MKITVLAVGKIKEKYFADALLEYGKRLGRYCTFQIVEVADEKTPENISAREKELILKKEGDRLRQQWDKLAEKKAVFIALAIDGTACSSQEFAKKISDLAIQGKSHIVFVIGGSLGLDKAILDRADERLSFSAMTFPHQLMRVILAEQIYRAFRIINGQPYHK